MKKKTAAKKKAGKSPAGKEKKIRGILRNLEIKIKELEGIRGELSELSMSEASPEATRAMLEEIKVPPLEIIRESPRNNRGKH